MDDSTPITEYLLSMVEAAILARASDIHLEPEERQCRVRWRIDGCLLDGPRPPLDGRDRLISSVKIMAQLDIAEKRRPQDGRFDFPLSDGTLRDIRVSSLPTIRGEKLVLRIMAPAQALPLAALGLETAQLAHLQRALARPHGMVLMTGPTGSGKTTSLYACLQSLPLDGINVCSVEDPVEIALSGANQVAVCEKSQLDFPNALRALLRQDPDVIMVGEMRDGVTADIAVKAAQTGHLVLSSVHTSGARATLARLINMGVAPFNLSSAQPLIVSQRLLRRLCRYCRRPVCLTLSAWRGAGWDDGVPEAASPYEAHGCAECQHTGYRGRLGVFELLPLAENALNARGELNPGLVCQPTLRQAALAKVMQGETSLSEVSAVVMD
ncbi:MAG: type II/IV secretion system protein [Paludibacterium sp.]|uniref:GspE/PulE family protein n=1 Tax=Paludibacterium sp. TaxID=1917523 RepID=UPI0025EBA6E0|nr:GspE/PulE family protein [Paludibacterium sp.]MBV8046598.1 type II/IV secretion system protein [Paludibacterium sp.]MBV8646029.1 type II/IV secretion system protein [Paludibacterium sp.]